MEDRIERRWHELGSFWEKESHLLGRDDEAVTQGVEDGLEEVFRSIGSVQKEEILSVYSKKSKSDR